MPPFVLAFDFLLGLLLLLFGRRLFWLFVGAAGFVAALQTVPSLMPNQPQWLVLAAAVLAGLVGAALAIFVQYVAAGLAGFLVGIHLAQALHTAFGVTTVEWLVILVGIGGALCGVFLFDWAIILLSAYLGAALLLEPFGLQSSRHLFAFVALFALGVILQVSMHLRLRETRRLTGT